MTGQPSSASGRPARPSLAGVFEAEQSPLLRYAFGLVGRREVAEELVQDAFLRLHQHWDEVRQPRAWLFRCVRNRAFNHLRDHRRERLGGAEDEPGPDGDDREAPDGVLARLEAAGLLRVLLAELEEADRDLLDLKYGEGLSYREIAERSGMNAGTVGWRLHHLLRKLADDLRKAGVRDGNG